MGTQKRSLSRGDCLKPTSVALLGDPLAFIQEDHLRERQICTLLDEIASGQAPDTEAVSTVLEFLTKELPLHLQDEEEDLFPLLRRRCKPEDEIGKVIEKLTADHTHADDDTPKIVAMLEELANDARAPQKDESAALIDFASHSRRHLILENAIILPFSHLRLTEGDLLTLHIRMCQRRGLDSFKDPENVERPA